MTSCSRSSPAACCSLPKRLREVVIAHYLEGRSQREMAEDSGEHQSTISRRLDKGVDELRRHLSKAGVAISAAAFALLLTENAAIAAPAALTANLGKLALGSSTATGSGAGIAAGAAKIKIAAVADRYQLLVQRITI